MGMFDDLEAQLPRNAPRQSGGMFDDIEASIADTRPAPSAPPRIRTKTATEKYRDEGGGFIKSLEKGLMSLMALTAPAGSAQTQSAAALPALMGDKRSKEIVADINLPQRSLEKALQQHNAMPKNPLGANIAAAYEANSGIDAPLAAAKELVTNPRLAGEYLTEMLVPALFGGGAGGGAAKLTADAAVKRLAPGLVKKLAPRAAAGAGANSGATFTGGLVPNTAAAYEENGGDLEKAVSTGLKQTGVESAVAAPFGAVLPFGRGVKVNAGKALAVSPIDEVAQTVAGNASIGKDTSGGEMIASALLGTASSPVDIVTALWAAKQGEGATQEPTATPRDLPPEAATAGPQPANNKPIQPARAESVPQTANERSGMFDDIEADMTADPILPNTPEAPAQEQSAQTSAAEIMPAPDPVESIIEEQDIPVEQSAADPTDQTQATPDVSREISQTQQPVETDGVRPLVENLIRRRRIANEMGKARILDNALSLGRDLLAGKPVNPGRFRNAAKALEKDKALFADLMALHDLAKSPRPQKIEEAEPVAPAATVAPRASRLSAMSDERLGNDEIRGLLPEFAKLSGWAERGGQILRDATTGEVTGRTKWVPRADWWEGKPEGVTERLIRSGVPKALNGQPITKPEREAVDWLMSVIEADVAEMNRESVALANELADDFDIPFEDFVGETDTRKQMEAMGFSQDEINETLEAEGRKTDEVAARPAQESNQSGDETQTAESRQEAFSLTQQTERELAEREAALAKREAEQNARERAALEKEKADRARDDFTLTGSDRAADANAGQGDIFSTKNEEARNGKPVAESQAPSPSEQGDAGVAPGQATVSPQQKDPWNMTFDEYRQRVKSLWGDAVTDDAETTQELRLQHLDFIETALEDGKAVADDALAGHAIDAKHYPLAADRQGNGTDSGDALNSEFSRTAFTSYVDFGTEPVVWSRVKADALKVTGLSSDVRVEIGKQMPPNVPMRFDLNRRVIEVNRSLGITHADAVQYMVEELLHSIDALNGTHTLSASSARLDLETGDIALEVKQHFAEGGKYSVFFSYPLDSKYDFSDDRIKAELFARLGALYFGEPDLMRQVLPLAYGAFDGIFQVRINPVTREVSRSIRGVAGRTTPARGESGPDGTSIRGDGKGSGNRDSTELGRLRDAVSEAFGTNRRGQRVDLNRLETRRVPSGPSSQQQPIRYPKQSGFKLDPETAIEGVQRKHQDSMNRWAKVQRQIAEQGGTVGLNQDVYHAMERMSGRAADRIDQFTHATIKPLLSRMTELKTGLDEIGTYLMALGAKDRNAYIQTIRQDMPDNGSGVSNAEAEQIIADYKTRPDFAEFDQLARDFQKITDRKLKVLVNGGVITQQQADKAKQDFGFYVPYKGFEKIDETGQRGNGTGLGYSTPSRASKRAFGRVSKAGQVVENIIRDYEAAIILAEKVNVGRYARALADANPDPALWTVDQPPSQPVMAGGSVALMQAQFDAENEIRYIENGKAVRIQLHDPLLAQTYNNLGQEPLNTLLRAGDALNRVLRQTYTQKNPAFIFVNAMRDIQTGLAAITGEMGAASAIKSLKYAPGAWRAASAESLKRGSVTGEWAKYVDAYRKSGAAVAYYAIGDIEAKQTKLNELLAREGGLSLLDQWKQKGGGMAGAKASAKLAFWRTYNNAVVDVIEALNGGFENMMRLSAFRQYIDEHGGIDNVSRETLAEASRIAKNLTVNFNRKGEKTRAMNAAYLFWNANVQGSQNLFRIATKSIHNNQVKALMGGMVGLGFLMSMTTDDEDDELTPGYVKNTNIVLHIDGKRIQIPLAYGLGYFVAMGYEMGSLVKGRQTPIRTGLNMLSSALMHFSPLGTPIHDGKTDMKDLAVAGTPTILKPIVMSATNRNSMGYEVVPKYDDDAPDRPAMRAATRGGVYDKASGGLEAVGLDVSPESIKMATTFVAGGLGTFLADSVSASMAGSKGEFDPEKTPILKRFYGVNDVEEYRARFYDQTDDVQTQAREQGKKQKEFFGSNKSENSVQDFRKVMKELREEEMEAYAKNNFKRAEALQEKQIKLATRFKVLHDRMIKTGRIEKR